MHTVIAGATGFIGRGLCRRLLEEGYGVIALSRDPDRGRKLLGNRVSVVGWDGRSAEGWASYADGARAIINLAGESIASGRWTQTKKRAILESRLDAGRAVVEAIKRSQKKPKVVIQASAIGYYGPRSDEMLDESSPPGMGFLAEVAQQWELSTKEAESWGVRHVIIRTGIVLGREGGVLPRLLLPFRLFVGGPLGSGRQWFSWIHLDDEVRAIRFLMEKEDLHGAFNLTAPEQLTMEDFCRVLGRAMNRPSWLSAPGFAMHLLLGEMAEEILLSGQRVVPKRLTEAGYKFLYPEVESALREILCTM
ncbi:MAG: TIGR01777 family oxidoreductase [bacterium]